jgi:hypothetical protein
LCRAKTKAGRQCLSPTVGPDGFCRSHSPAHREALLAQSRNGGRKTASNYHEAMEQFVESNRRKIVGVYRDGLEATKIAVDQRTAQAVDTGQPDHAIRLQTAERVLDRVFGKATTRTEITGQLNLAALMADSPQALTNTRLD